MENKSNKKILIAIIVAICAIIGILCFVIVSNSPKNNNKNNDSTSNINDTTDTNSSNNNESNDNSENFDDLNKDIYSKYPDIKWASQIGTKYNIDGEIDIMTVENGQVKCIDEYSSYCNYINSNIKENVKKITILQDYEDIIYILTEEGKSYKIDFIFGNITLDKILENIDLKDMTILYRNYRFAHTHVESGWDGTINYVTPYFLTADGKLLSPDKTSFEDDNRDFVNSNCIINLLEHTSMLCLYYDKDNNVNYRGEKVNQYHQFAKEANYLTAKDKNGNQLVAKYLYDGMDANFSHRKLIIVDKNDELYAIDNGDENFTLKYIGNLSNSSVVSGPNDNELYNIVLNLSDGNKYEFYSSEDSYFDVANYKEVKITR